MTYYLYVPFKKKDVPFRQQAIIDQWVKVENEKRIGVQVCYAGEKTLSNLPPAAKIHILFHGKVGQPSPISGIGNISTELVRCFESLSQHLRIKDGKQSVLVPGVVDKMIEDGLLIGFNTHLHIKLFFYDEDKKTALNLTKAFLNSILSKPLTKNSNIRLDYYSDNPKNTPQNTPQNIIPFAPRPKPKSKSEEFIEQAREPRHSFFNKEECAPKLTLEHMSQAIKNYNEYKSSRCCGLSGLLNLNGFFSSDDSDQAIKYLNNPNISKEIRFDFASKFVTNCPNNYFTQCLKPVVEDSLKENQFI